MPSLMNGVASHLSNSFMRVSKRLVLPRLPVLRANAAQIMLHASDSMMRVVTQGRQSPLQFGLWLWTWFSELFLSRESQEAARVWANFEYTR